MANPAPQQQPVVVVAGIRLRQVLLVAGCVLFVLASLATAGDSLDNIPAWTWGFGALAAWILSGVV